jgi:chitin-binding protein
MLGWMVDWNLPAGHRIDSLWNGAMTAQGQAVMVHNAGHNGSLAPGQSASFGYVATGSAADTASALTCRLG